MIKLFLTLLSVVSFATLPVIEFTVEKQDVAEGKSITVALKLDQATSKVVTVPFTVTGTATYPDDHNLISSVAAVTPGQTWTSFTFMSYADDVEDNFETIEITLEAPMNARLGNNTVHTILLRDQEGPLPTVNFSTATQNSTEGDQVLVTVELSEPTTHLVYVPYTVSGSADSSDHNLVNGTAFITPGMLSSTISITINEDDQLENIEDLVITMTPPILNAELGETSVHTISIIESTAGVRGIKANNPVLKIKEDAGNNFASMELFNGSNPPGGFNGGGTGNKAYVSLTDFNDVRLTDLQTIAFHTKVPNTSALNRNVYVNFTVDLNCDENNRDFAVIVIEYMFSGAGPQGQWNSYSFNSTDAVFRSVGGKGGLPGHLDPSAGALSMLTNNHADACLVNDNPLDNGHPKDTSMPGILLVLGDSGTTTASEVYVDNISVTLSSGVFNYDFE